MLEIECKPIDFYQLVSEQTSFWSSEHYRSVRYTILDVKWPVQEPSIKSAVSTIEYPGCVSTCYSYNYNEKEEVKIVFSFWIWLLVNPRKTLCCPLAFPIQTTDFLKRINMPASLFLQDINIAACQAMDEALSAASICVLGFETRPSSAS